MLILLLSILITYQNINSKKKNYSSFFLALIRVFSIMVSGDL